MDHQCNCVITILYYIHVIFALFGIIKVIKDETFIGRCNRRQ
jgi:hypothetical protein